MSKPQIPPTGTVVGRAVERLVEVRPSAAPHVESGHYGNVIEGWRGQFKLARRRLVDEALAARLFSSRGQALSDLTASEYEVARRTEPTFAIGEVVLSRDVIHYVKTSSLEVTHADSTTEATAASLHAAMLTAWNAHRVSVFDAASGVGAHRTSDAVAPDAMPGSPTLTQLVDTTNQFRSVVRLHLDNLAPGTPYHFDADTANAIPTTGDAYVEIKASAAATQAWRVDDSAGSFADVTVTAGATGDEFVLFPTSEAIDDYCALGYGEKFSRLTVNSVDVGTAGVGGSVAWEYWNGSSWQPLPSVVDQTVGFTASVGGVRQVTWTAPSDWATLQLNGSSLLYYVRARVTGTYSTNPSVDQILVGWSDNYLGATVGARQALHRAQSTLKSSMNGHFEQEGRPGAIRAGHRFALVANAEVSPPVPDAIVRAVRDVAVTVGTRQLSVGVEAVEPGPGANLPAVEGRTYDVQSLDRLYDTGATYAWAPTGSIDLAGGADAQTDAELVAAARANWTGRHGPTTSALLAGALAAHGASVALVREDAASGTARVFAADPSWASSSAWRARLSGVLSAGFLGWGCRLGSARVINQAVRVEITIVLREAAYLLDTTTITTGVQQRLRAYFDSRPDWYVWTFAGIRAAAARGDRRIFSVSTVTVRDSSDVAISAPSVPAASAETLTHYWLDGVSPSYVAT